MSNIQDRTKMIEHLENLSDAEILQNALNDPDALPMTASELANPMPMGKLSSAQKAKIYFL